MEGDDALLRFEITTVQFLSTPSGWRATRYGQDSILLATTFLSTPSGWRATGVFGINAIALAFLSTPSGWRATAHDV